MLPVPARLWVALVSLALIVFAIDTSAVRGHPAWWASIYLAAAAWLWAWTWTRRGWMLVAFGATLFTAASSRVIVFAIDGQRWTGAANNLLVMLFVVDFVAAHRWGRR